jgi:hypothetical protein
MDHAAAERLDPLQCLGDVVDGEVRQREGIAGSASTSMDANRGRARLRLPAFSLSCPAILQFNAEEVHPEVTGALWIVCRKLNERQRRLRHGAHDTRQFAVRLDAIRWINDRAKLFNPKAPLRRAQSSTRRRVLLCAKAIVIVRF